MTKAEKEKYLNMKTIAVNSDYWFPIEIKEFEYGIDFSVIFVFSNKVYKRKLHHGRDLYFVFANKKIYTSDFIRIDTQDYSLF